MRRGDIGGPVKLVGLVTSHDEDVALVDDHNFTLADLLVKNFETCPLEPLEVVESVLVQLGEVKQFLGDGLAIRPA